MKTQIKRMFSTLLVLAIVLSSLPLNANASSAAEIKAKLDEIYSDPEYRNASYTHFNNGSMSGCYAFLNAICQNRLFGVRIPTQASDTTLTMPYSYWTQVGSTAYSNSAVISLLKQSQSGDIFEYKSSYATSRHIAMVFETTSSGITVWDNTSASNGARLKTYTWSNVVPNGLGSFDASSAYALSLYRCTKDVISPSPAIPTISSVQANGPFVTVTWGDVANETSYDVYLLQAPWGWEDVKYSGSVGANVTSYTFENVADGIYSAFVISRPTEDSQRQSKWVEVVVKSKLDKPNLINMKASYYTDEDIAFNWQKSGATASYTLTIYKKENGAWRRTEEIKRDSCSAVKRLGAGEYCARVDAFASYARPDGQSATMSSSSGNEAYFTVTQRTSASISSPSVSGDVCSVRVTCSQSGASVLFAEYDKSGKMVALRSEAIRNGGGNYSFKLPKRGNYVQIFVVGADLAPLCAAVTVRG